jgi:hypothetical protein
MGMQEIAMIRQKGARTMGGARLDLVIVQFGFEHDWLWRWIEPWKNELQA